MADKNRKWPDNVSGKYYVDEQCIDCDACRAISPDHFTRNEARGFAFVAKQPAGSREEEQCRAALQTCPVEAIGSDGSH